MARRIRITTTKPANLADTDPRIVAVTAAARQCADDVWTANGWRKAPAQCLVCSETIKGQPLADMLAIMSAWSRAFDARHNEYADAAIKAAGIF